MSPFRQFNQNLQLEDVIDVGEFASLTDDFDRYLWIRAQLILGKVEVATDAIRNWESSAPSHALTELLTLQARGFKRERLEESIELLRHWIAARVAEVDQNLESAYLLGEAHFSLGYLLGSISRYKAALREFVAAIPHYLRSGHLGQAGIARFNVCLCANHLGLEECRDREFALFSREATEFQAQSENAVLSAFAERFRAYRALEAGRAEEAQSHFISAKQIFSRLNRLRDYGEILSLELYLALKSQSVSQVYLLQSEWHNFRRVEKFSAPHLDQRLSLFSEIMDVAIPNATQFSALLRASQKSGIDGLSLVLAGDLMLQALNRAKRFEDTIRLYRQAAPLAEKHEQMPWLIDYRPYLAEALKESGHDAASARPSLHALKRQESDFCEIDLQQGEVRFKTQTFLVRDYPLVLKMLRELSDAPAGVSYERLFRLIYGKEFNPILHQARYHSLISRTRRFLPKDALIWQDGLLQLNPRQALHVIAPSVPVSQKREDRQTQLLKWIRRLKREITAGDLLSDQGGPFFGYSRRTLQYDLEHLVKGNQLRRSGAGKKTTYQL